MTITLGQMVDWALVWAILGGFTLIVASGTVTTLAVIGTLRKSRGAPAPIVRRTNRQGARQ